MTSQWAIDARAPLAARHAARFVRSAGISALLDDFIAVGSRPTLTPSETLR